MTKEERPEKELLWIDKMPIKLARVIKEAADLQLLLQTRDGYQLTMWCNLLTVARIRLTAAIIDLDLPGIFDSFSQLTTQSTQHIEENLTEIEKLLRRMNTILSS